MFDRARRALLLVLITSVFLLVGGAPTTEHKGAKWTPTVAVHIQVDPEIPVRLQLYGPIFMVGGFRKRPKK